MDFQVEKKTKKKKEMFLNAPSQHNCLLSAYVSFRRNKE